jgi:hypothetical protein
LAAERGLADAASGRPLGRYRCTNADCGWQGLLPVARPAPWLRAASVLLVATLTLLVGVQGARHLLGAQPSPLSLAPGEHHEGELLPPRHPWLRPVVLRPADSASALPAPADRDTPILAIVEPLALRKNCVWGQPGRNPYQGTVEQALLHARLPPEVVREISRKVKAHEVSDRLEIRTGRIHGVGQGHEFDPQRLLLTYGRTLCLNARVNFAPGHVEGADLYEATDARGRRHAVMVPDVCGNVSVLGARGERKRRLNALAVDGDRGGDDEWSLLATGAEPDPSSVPEPGSLAAVLTALAALALIRARRSRLVAATVERPPRAD